MAQPQTAPLASRVEIFLDGSNFYNGLRLQFGSGRYSVEKLVRRILAGRPLVRLNFYTGLLDPARQSDAAAAQQRFLATVQALPFPTQVFTWPMKYPPAWPKIPPQEKGIDAKMVEDLIIGAVDQRYNVAVILTGDRDFIHVVNLLHRRFRVALETYYPAARRHLFEECKTCFAHAEVINQAFHRAIS